MAEPSMGRSEPYRGESAAVVHTTSQWFCSEDVPPEHWDGEYLVQIEEVHARRGVRFNKGRAREVELFLKFTGLDRELRVNMTIRRVLDQLFGPVCGDWFGKWIALYVQRGVKCEGGEERTGVRVRNRAVAPPKPTKPATPPAAAPKAPAATAPAPAAAQASESDEVDGMRRDIARLMKEGGVGDVKRVAAACAIPLAGRTIASLTPDEVERIWTHTVGGEPLPAAPAAAAPAAAPTPAPALAGPSTPDDSPEGRALNDRLDNLKF